MARPEKEQSERVEDLAETSERILDKVERLRALERRRRNVDVSSPEFHRLAGDIETVSHDIFRAAVTETALAETVETTDQTLEEVSEDGTRG